MSAAPPRLRPRDLARRGAPDGARRRRRAPGARADGRAGGGTYDGPAYVRRRDPEARKAPRMNLNGNPPATRSVIATNAPVLDRGSALGLAAMSGAALALAFPIVDWG